MDLKAHIRHVPDFPKKGILFYDISTLLAHGPAREVRRTDPWVVEALSLGSGEAIVP